MAFLEYFWNDNGKPIYPACFHSFSNGYLKVVHPEGSSVRLPLAFLNAVALNRHMPKVHTVPSHYWYKYWLLGRLFDLHHGSTLRKLVYQRYQFGFGHLALEAGSVERLPESEEEPVKGETRDTEAAPITERPTPLRPPRVVLHTHLKHRHPPHFQLPNVPEMSFRIFEEVIPVVSYMAGDDYMMCRQTWGPENIQADSGAGWLAPEGYVRGGKRDGSPCGLFPSPSVRKREWMCGWDTEQIVLGNRSDNVVFSILRRELVQGHKIHQLKDNFGRANRYDYY